MQTVEQVAGRDAIKEWFEHPVTGWIANALRERADHYAELRANAFAPGDPNRTQETISFFNGVVDELNALYGVLNEIQEDNEPCSLNYIHPEFEVEDE